MYLYGVMCCMQLLLVTCRTIIKLGALLDYMLGMCMCRGIQFSTIFVEDMDDSCFSPLYVAMCCQQLLFKVLLDNDKTWWIIRLHIADVQVVRNFISYNLCKRNAYLVIIVFYKH